MDLAFSEEHNELRSLVRRFFAAESSEEKVRAAMETPRGYDLDLWERLASQLDLQGLIVPEAYGGAGFGQVELGIVFEEMGRALVCAPFLSTIGLACNALLIGANEQAREEYLPGIAKGDLIVTMAIADEDSNWDPRNCHMDATPDGRRSWRLTGRKRFVLDGAVAQVILVVANTPDGPTLFAVEGKAEGLTRTDLSTLDKTRRLADIEFRDTRATPIGPPGSGSDTASRAVDLAIINLAAEQVGGTARTLDDAVEYAKIRRQFGRPVGSFQAIKHVCADGLMALESARSAAYFASAIAADGDPAALAAAASLAKSTCSVAFLRNADMNIHVHGGIGFTWEHSAHLYFRRAKASELLFGDVQYHRERFARQLEGSPAVQQHTAGVGASDGSTAQP
jgi:alkylation response protein AidB-like acyl-CoA dehydrogenase